MSFWHDLINGRCHQKNVTKGSCVKMYTKVIFDHNIKRHVHYNSERKEICRIRYLLISGTLYKSKGWTSNVII